MVTLTQNLYLIDEVKLSFLTALLKKQDINECRYWLNEISLTVGETEVRNYLNQIYYDFYYATNNTFTVSLEQLFALPASPLVFLLGQLKLEKPKVIYIKGSAVAGWLAVIKDERLHPFIRAVNKNQYDGVSYYANKLLSQDGISGEELVKALCCYYKTAFIEKNHLLMSDDLQYVLAVYVKLHYLRKGYKTVKCITTDKRAEGAGAVSIPLSIGAFKLQRWELMQGGKEERLFQDDPVLIAFGLALSDRNCITDTIFAAMNYIKTQLKEEDEEKFIECPEVINDISGDIIIEQKDKQRLWLEKMKTEYSSNVMLEILPTFACTWLNEVFPDTTKEEGIMGLFNYKMLELNY